MRPWVRAICCALAVVAVAAPSAFASRAPTLAEREAITRALPAFHRNAPTECLWLSTRVSRNGRYALVDPVPLNGERPGSRCARYAADGFYILRKSTRWRIVFLGSDLPSCSKKIPRDLIACLP